MTQATDKGAGPAMIPGLSPAKVARMAGVSARFVHKAIRAGELTARRVGAHYRIPHSAALAFAVACGAEPAEQAGTTRTSEPIAHNAHGSKLTLARPGGVA
jgi:excisionase family DNA binding protein